MFGDCFFMVIFYGKVGNVSDFVCVGCFDEIWVIELFNCFYFVSELFFGIGMF